MTETLKRCPFCGNWAEIYKDDEDYYHAYCPKCGAETDMYGSPETAIKKWNARPIEDELDKKNGYLIDTCHDLHDIVEDFRAERDQKDLEIKRLREALELIAKAKFYFARDEDKEQIGRIYKIAKEALKGGEE